MTKPILNYRNSHIPNKIRLTQQGKDKLQARFDFLTHKRPQVLVELQRAREMGDLSENGAYKAARFELSSLDRELRKLTYDLKYSFVDESKSQTDRVDFGCSVTIKINGIIKTFQVVSSLESNPNQATISDRSPIGRSLMGHKVGETVMIQTPGGETSCQILQIS